MIYALAGCTVDYSCAWSKVDYMTPSRHLLTYDHCRARIFFSEMTCFTTHSSTLIEKQPYEKIMVSIRMMDWELGNSEYIENVTYLYTEYAYKTCSANKLDRLNLTFDGGGLMCPPKVFLFFYQKSLPLTKP